MKGRGSGILLHITSLPGKYGVGDLGPGAYKFADFLAGSGQRYWQILPLNPPAERKSQSPYNCLSAFAGNTLLISPELLYKEGLLKKSETSDIGHFNNSRVAFEKVIQYKNRLFNLAFGRFKARRRPAGFERFCRANAYWLDEFAVFAALRQYFKGRLWCDWPVKLRDRDKDELGKVQRKYSDAIEREKFLQYVFFKQWHSLKTYCNKKQISLIGDMPIYVAYDSSDVWCYPDMFKLTKGKKMRYVTGVPPDLFSSSGQLWGNPVYNWNYMKKDKYGWWLKRMEHNFRLFDIIRIDHFRGFVAYWQIPAHHKTATKGRWVAGPKADFLDVVVKRFASSAVIAEDLGYITEEVTEIIHGYDLAVMKVLLFAFDGQSSRNKYLPHNYSSNCVVYTGTHDNNTVRGWYRQASGRQRKQLFCYLDKRVNSSEVHRELIRLAMSSVADTAIIPLQDVLGLTGRARMNNPAGGQPNWRWRFEWRQFDRGIRRRLAGLTETYGRR